MWGYKMQKAQDRRTKAENGSRYKVLRRCGEKLEDLLTIVSEGSGYGVGQLRGHTVYCTMC